MDPALEVDLRPGHRDLDPIRFSVGLPRQGIVQPLLDVRRDDLWRELEPIGDAGDAHQTAHCLFGGLSRAGMVLRRIKAQAGWNSAAQGLRARAPRQDAPFAPCR
jgi:hypothetical protein